MGYQLSEAGKWYFIDDIENIPISASYGYAFGKGKELEEIIHRADQMMYENKRKFHEMREE